MPAIIIIIIKIIKKKIDNKGLTQVPFEPSGECLAGSTYWNQAAPVPLQTCIHLQSVAALMAHSISVNMN